MKIYVDHILFGATNKTLCKDFTYMMQNEFEIFMMGKLWHFFGLKIHETKQGTFIFQDKY